MGFESYPVGRVSAVMGGREAEEAGGCLSLTPSACATPGWRTSFRVLVTRSEQVGSALESSVNTARYQAAFANSFGTRYSTPRATIAVEPPYAPLDAHRHAASNLASGDS